MATSNIDKQSFGQAGAVYESGTDNRTGEFCALTITEDTKFEYLEWDELDDEGQDVGALRVAGDSHNAARRLANTTSNDADTIPAGITIYGQISRFKLHSGAVLAYLSA